MSDKKKVVTDNELNDVQGGFSQIPLKVTGERDTQRPADHRGRDAARDQGDIEPGPAAQNTTS